MSTFAVYRQVDESIDWVSIASIVASVVYATYIHHYVVRLERIGCGCAMDFRRSYIQWYTLALVVIGVVNIVLRLAGGDAGLAFISVVLSPIVLLATIVYIIFVLQYVNRLRREKCHCSETMARAILYIITIIYTILACLLSLIALYMVLTEVGSAKGRAAVFKRVRGKTSA